MLLLGYGLVEVPRWLLDASRVQYSLNRCYFRAAKLYEEMTEANEHLEEITEVGLIIWGCGKGSITLQVRVVGGGTGAKGWGPNYVNSCYVKRSPVVINP